MHPDPGPADARAGAYLRGYALFEQLQGDDPAAALAELPELLARAEEQAWPDVAFVAAAGLALDGVLRPVDAAATTTALGDLLRRAQTLDDPPLVALALGLRAVAAAVEGDTEVVLSHAGRAVALLDEVRPNALDRCTAYVVCAGAYNALSLWELADELYGTAVELGPQCVVPAQAAAVAVNRILIRLEQATALLEGGEDDRAREQLDRALAAAGEARDVPMPRLWQLDVEACDTALRLLLGEPADPLLARAAQQRAGLAAGGDVEVLPLLDAAVALTVLRAGRHDEAAAVVAGFPDGGSTSSGARSFPAWVRARVAAAVDASPAAAAADDYARLVARQRWQSRTAVLVAARSFVALERLQIEHLRLTRDVRTDPLTGLQNRRAFDAWLSRPLGRAAVVLLDLDGFKQVNDTLGHALGDEVLRRVGRIVGEHVRPGDLALRHGGDELAVVLDGASEAVALQRAEALLQAIRTADWASVVPGMTVGASLGVAVGAGDADALYRAADAALYSAKRGGGGRVVLAAT